MFLWVIYDISDNKLRKHISEKCKDYGLERVQRSAFFGELSANATETLGIELEELFEKNKEKTAGDCVFLLPMCNSCISKKIIIGKSFDEGEFKHKFYTIFG